MAHESFTYTAITVPLTTLTAVDEIAVVKVPATATIKSIYGSLRSLVSGTHTVTLKNGSGSTLGTVSWTAAGTANGTINIAEIDANDNIHFDITSAGVSVADCAVTIWLRMDSIA